MELQPRKKWWWPYQRVFVVRAAILLFILKIILGNAAGIGLAAQGNLSGWKVVLGFTNRTYDFGWAELTEGEGSLFWIVAVNGYGEYDLKNIAKFPLYPAVARTIWDLTGRTMSLPLIMSLIHGLMVWAAVAEVYRFWEEYRAGYGKRAVMWLLFSPLFVFHVWLASYAEPGIIALIWLSLTLERNRRWATSSAALMCLALLQPSGIILACFIGIRRLYQWFQGQSPRSAVLWALLPAGAWLTWMGITSLWLDRFLAPYAFQAEWGRTTYIWPWERWIEYIEITRNLGNFFGNVVMNFTIAWIVLGYAWGVWLWRKLPEQQRQMLGGGWVLPLFSLVIVMVPFSTTTIGANRYALTTLIGIWPLLFSQRTQDRLWFRLAEIAIWVGSAMMCFLVLYAFITGYKHTWNLYF